MAVIQNGAFFVISLQYLYETESLKEYFLLKTTSLIDFKNIWIFENQKYEHN